MTRRASWIALLAGLLAALLLGCGGGAGRSDADLRGVRLAATVDAPVQVVTPRKVTRARADFPQPAEPFDDPFAR
jgi:hypothetical protein